MTAAALFRHLLFIAGLAAVSASVVKAMIWARFLDHPDERKSHDRPTPKGGGVGIVLAFLLGILVLYEAAQFARIGDPYFRGVILAAMLIAIVAFMDDIRVWPFTVKLGAQLVAALGAVGSGLYVQVFHLPYLPTVDIGWLGIPATLFWIVFATNAMNFIDGLNGLAGGVALIACGFLAAAAAEQGAWFAYFAALLLAAGLLGFLPFNFPRAQIFMGDVGSQFCGFILAVLGVAAARFQTVELSFLVVPMLLSGVLFDVAVTLFRRALAGERLTEAHRGHLYQIAQRSGIPAIAVTLVHWGFATFGGICCLLFLHAASVWKPVLAVAPLGPQLIWAAFVATRARPLGLLRWSPALHVHQAARYDG